MKDTIEVPLSFGEVLDKITILEIKSERIENEEKISNVRLELDALNSIWEHEIHASSRIGDLRVQMKSVNEELWDIEDDIRAQEAKQDFGPQFVSLSRSVYFTNDRRAAIKKDVNLHLGSRFVEEKSYQDYTSTP
ncbi:DUF6165 family protein [Vreelandella arcis]|uniref:Uncharacterized protein n=1 Tax=Vreelandella arcis TaxID=416873 RepID=A0A1H0IPM0_9GAMM|nr:DUF6165 family protein [Halomonas arcis]SDO33336.1 hypothetical protein SAMN04487951_12127 [Halomonas arcis]